MNLRELLRNDFKDYIRSVFVKDRCEICGESENLHLHHIDKFHNLLMETLEELKLQELDSEDYDEMELQSIRNFMLAKQLKCKYKTLCKNCHMKLHGKEKYEDEYKAHYYNPYGGYVIINNNALNKLEIEPNLLFRFIFLCANMNYDGYIVDKSKHQNNKVDIKTLQPIFKLSKTEYYNTINKLKEKRLITIDDKGIIINKKYVTKGRCNYQFSSKLFIDNFINLYNNVIVTKHKYYGNLLKLYSNSKYGVINKSIHDILYFCKQTNITRFINNSTEYIPMFKKVNRNTYLINPSIWYDRGLDGSFKTIIEQFNSL